jgi:hypothetical protein
VEVAAGQCSLGPSPETPAVSVAAQPGPRNLGKPRDGMYPRLPGGPRDMLACQPVIANPARHVLPPWVSAPILCLQPRGACLSPDDGVLYPTWASRDAALDVRRGLEGGARCPGCYRRVALSRGRRREHLGPAGVAEALGRLLPRQRYASPGLLRLRVRPRPRPSGARPCGRFPHLRVCQRWGVQRLRVACRSREVVARAPASGAVLVREVGEKAGLTRIAQSSSLGHLGGPKCPRLRPG